MMFGWGCSEGTSFREVFRKAAVRVRLVGFFAGFSVFSGFSGAAERCFLGDKTGSVFTGSGRC